MIPVEVEGNDACQIGAWFEASAIRGLVSRSEVLRSGDTPWAC